MPDHEGLQVVDHYAGLEVRKIYPVPAEKLPIITRRTRMSKKDDFGPLQVDTRTQKAKDGKHCALKKSVFGALIAVFVIVVVTIAVGAGIGASTSHNKAVSANETHIPSNFGSISPYAK
jgi:hypothetical protein